MGFFDKLKDKTVADVVDTAKEKVSDTVKSVTENKMKTVLTLLPIAAAAFIVFGGRKEDSSDPPAHQIINNYYYGERRDELVSDDHKSSR